MEIYCTNILNINCLPTNLHENVNLPSWDLLGTLDAFDLLHQLQRGRVLSFNALINEESDEDSGQSEHGEIEDDQQFKVTTPALRGCLASAGLARADL